MSAVELSSRPAPSGRTAGMGFILITLLLDILGIGLIIPVMPALAQELAGSDNEGMYGWLMASYALMQFLCAPLIGALSDRYGRRPVLLASILALGFEFLLTGLAPNLAWLFVARILAGMAAANITAANAYIADVSTEATRVRNFGLAGAMFGVGFILGPVMGGLLGTISPRAPFFAAAGLSFVNFCYGYFILPESLPVEQRRWVPLGRLNPFSALLNLKRFSGVFPIAMIFLLSYLAEHSMRSTWVFYGTKRFGWGPFENGLALGAVGVFFAVIQGGLVRPIARTLGERRTMLVGLLASATAYLIYAFITTGWMMYPIMLIGAFGGLTMPAAQSLVGRQVPSNEQGAVQGALTSMGSLAAIIAPPAAASLFEATTISGSALYLPGSVFLVAATLQLCALVIVYLVVRPAPMTATPRPVEAPQDSEDVIALTSPARQ